MCAIIFNTFAAVWASKSWQQRDKQLSGVRSSHHKKVQLTDIHFGPNLDVRHPNPFWVLCDIQIEPADIQFQKIRMSNTSMIFGIGCPHSFEMELDVHFKTFQK